MSPARAGDTPEAEAAPARGQGDAPGEPEGAISTIRGDAALEPTAPAQHLTDWAPILDALTLPQRRYLAALQSGAGQEQALLRAGGSGSKGVSPATVQEWLAGSREFARAHDSVHRGLAVLGVPQSRALAAADMPDLVGHWSRKARHAEKDRDQATFGRLVSDVAGATGQGTQVQVSVQSSWRLPPTPLTHQPGGIIEGEWREPDAAAEPVPLDTVPAAGRCPELVEGPEPERREAADAERTDDEHR